MFSSLCTVRFNAVQKCFCIWKPQYTGYEIVEFNCLSRYSGNILECPYCLNVVGDMV